MRKAILGLGGIAVLLSLLVAVPMGAQEEGAGFLAARGRVSFRLYCASCHGADGRGDGSVAKFLKVVPSDLTLLLQKYEGKLPEEKLRAIIDGREEVRAHGRREMPVWGDVFQDPIADMYETEESGEDRAERKIQELIMFLRTIQAAEPVMASPEG
jgi:mono/diheme cytochrome c family protein